jgi:RimJ/RimL family protein N-acetyltransferase
MPATSLREVREEDLPIFYEHQREPEGIEMSAVASRDWDSFMAHWHGEKVFGNPRARTKTVLAGGEVVGNVVSWEEGDRRFLGYWFGKAHWGKGFATAAVAAFLAEHETARPLFAFVASRNIGSRRVLEKCGFRPAEGTTAMADGSDALFLVLVGPAPAT